MFSGTFEGNGSVASVLRHFLDPCNLDPNMVDYSRNFRRWVDEGEGDYGLSINSVDSSIYFALSIEARSRLAFRDGGPPFADVSPNDIVVLGSPLAPTRDQRVE